jgi:hypothetical protein
MALSISASSRLSRSQVGQDITSTLSPREATVNRRESPGLTLLSDDAGL